MFCSSQQERFELMPGAKLLPRSPEVGWALRDEEEYWGHLVSEDGFCA